MLEKRGQLIWCCLTSSSDPEIFVVLQNPLISGFEYRPSLDKSEQIWTHLSWIGPYLSTINPCITIEWFSCLTCN